MASRQKPDPYKIDDETAPLTDDEVSKLKPAAAVFSELGIAAPPRRGRPKADDPKVQVTIRLQASVIESLKSTGAGWQTRLSSEIERLTKSGGFAVKQKRRKGI